MMIMIHYRKCSQQRELTESALLSLLDAWHEEPGWFIKRKGSYAVKTAVRNENDALYIFWGSQSAAVELERGR